MAAPQGHSESTDPALVSAALDGDRDAFAAIYDRYVNPLYDFCASMLRDAQDAEDAVQDTFVLAAERLTQLRDPQRLRPWLYAVARSVALRRLRGRARLRPMAQVDDHPDPTVGPEDAATQRQQRELVWAAATGLSDRDRALLDLHLRQGLDGAELSAAMGVSTAHSYVLLSRLRDRVERSLGALLIARLGRQGCTELDAMLGGWDGRFSPLVRKRVARHVDSCEICGERKRRLASPWALLAAVPPLAAPATLRDRVLGDLALVAHAGAPPDGRGSSDGAANPPAARWSRNGRALAAGALAMALAGAAAVLTLIGPDPGTAATGESVSSAAADPSSTAQPAGPIGPMTSGVVTPGPVTPGAGPPELLGPPRVINQSAAPSALRIRGCPPDQASIQATVDAPAGVASVTLRRSGVGGTGSAPMTAGAGRWVTTLGPFPTLGTTSWQVTVIDRQGRSATGPTGVVTVSPCPQGPPAGPGGLTTA